MTITVIDGKCFVEAIPGMLSFIATKPAWDGLSVEGRLRMIQLIYERLGLQMMERVLS